MAHQNAGRKQSPEHIAKRTAAMIATRAAWSDERRAVEAAKTSASSWWSSTPEGREHCRKIATGKSPPNKGNNWRDKHTPEEVRAIKAKRARDRRIKAPWVRIRERISAGIRNSIRSGKDGRSWEALVGYTFTELMEHLRKTLPNGYVWADFEAGALHIEHKVPVSAFNFGSPDDFDFRRCWALSNLRLLPALENLKKGSKLTAPFQPSLL